MLTRALNCNKSWDAGQYTSFRVEIEPSNIQSRFSRMEEMLLHGSRGYPENFGGYKILYNTVLGEPLNLLYHMLIAYLTAVLMKIVLFWTDEMEMLISPTITKRRSTLTREMTRKNVISPLYDGEHLIMLKTKAERPVRTQVSDGQIAYRTLTKHCGMWKQCKE